MGFIYQESNAYGVEALVALERHYTPTEEKYCTAVTEAVRICDTYGIPERELVPQVRHIAAAEEYLLEHLSEDEETLQFLFTPLSGFFDSGSVAASGKSGIKNRIVSEDETVSRKSGSSGKSGDGGEAGWFRKSKRRRGDPVGSPIRLYRKRDALFQGALPPKGYAAKGLCRQ